MGLSLINRVVNDEVDRITGIEWESASRVNQRVLRWFGDWMSI